MDRVLTFHTHREAYAPEQLENYDTFTIGELIAYLENFDRDIRIMYNNDNGYTYGTITENDLRFENLEGEEEEEDYQSSFS